MSLARKKQLLTLDDGKPASWPNGWLFPAGEALPPGYPKPFPAGYKLLAERTPQGVSVQVYDEWGEDTDYLDGEYVKIECAGRVSRDGELWSKAALARLDKCGWADVALLCETGPVRVSVYGYAGGEISI